MSRRRPWRVGANGTDPPPAAFWVAGFALLGAAIIARAFVDLSASPPGLYTDEASIAYNAWAVAQFGVDEHGAHLPLYFEAFGEFKNPLYIYALVPLARWLPLSAAVERFPAALFGLLATLFLALTAWRVTGSRASTLFVLALAGLTPWLVQESRVGFEVISMLATLSIALWCLADEHRVGPARFTVAGLFFALSIFAYSVGRLEILLFAVAFAAVYARRRYRGWWRTLVLIVAGYLVLGVWALQHPGALTYEFNLRSIGADGAALPTLMGRFLGNYISYFSPDFLFIHGDPNPRHNTGYAGMLLVVAAPLLLLGLWACWRRRHEALPRFVIACLLLGPVPAALTNNGGAPHALRSAVMLPFCFMLVALGLASVADALRRRRIVPVVLSAALAVQGGLYLLDMYTAYPVRAAAAFDAGLPEAIDAAARLAAGHTVFLSQTFEQSAVYIDAFYALLPPPPPAPSADSTASGLKRLGMVVADAGEAAVAARPGDVLVLAPDDPVPAGARLVTTEPSPGNPLAPNAPEAPLVDVYRVAAVTG